MSKRDPFAFKLRDSAHYRRDRLQVERERMLRSLQWAVARNDDEAADWIEKKIDAIEAELDADIRPGKRPGRLG